MIIEKAVDKAQKIGSSVDFFSEIDNKINDSIKKEHIDQSISKKSRLVEIDQEYIYSQGCLTAKSVFGEIESYKILRTRLHQYMLNKNWNSLMITSAHEKEGKTITAINLSLSFAKQYNQKVLLVDLDFRKQNIYKYLGYPSKVNLIDHLMDNIPLSDVIVRLQKENIAVISGERTIDTSTELIGSPHMIKLFDELKNKYNDRMVIFDLPPVLFLADAIASSSWIDSILFVVRFRKTSLEDIQRSLNLLPRDKFLGFVINRSRISNNGYSKYYA